MKTILTILVFFLFLFTPARSFAQEPQNTQRNEFERGKVIKILEQGEKKFADITQNFQILEVKILTGQDKDKTVKIEHGTKSTIKNYNLVHTGDEVVLSKLGNNETREYFIFDKFRLPQVIFILFGFFALVIGFSRFRGLASIVGMIVSLAVLVKYVVPSIAYGQDPVTTSLIGASVIVFVSIFLAHGFNKRTTIAVGGTVITLVIAVVLSLVFVELTKLSGSGNEDAYSLQFGQFSGINLKGLLLAGIIIGALGVLDDITTSLSAAVDELHKANPKLNAKELYLRGLSVGREHISSLVNTLVLAYAGTSMPLFLFFFSTRDLQPLWVTLNSELIIEEVVRALAGSITLVLAVPITTFLAAVSFGRLPKTKRG